MTSSENNSSSSSSGSNNTTTTAVKTPPRHSYANPHSPIASIKRPRSSLQRAASRSSSSSFSANGKQRNSISNSDTTATAMLLSPKAAAAAATARTTTPTPPFTTAATTIDEAAEQALSPMHAVVPVQRENGEKDGMVVKAVRKGSIGTNHNNATTLLSPSAAATAAAAAADGDSPSSSSATTPTSWVGRKVDALFSPVLRFLEQSEDAAAAAAATTTTTEVDDDEEEAADLAANTTDTDTNPSSCSNATAESSSPDSMMMMILSEDDDVDVDRCCQQQQPQDDKNSNNHNQDHHDSASVHSESSLSMQGVGAPDEDSDEFNPWQFIQSLPPYSHVQHLCPPVALPPKAAAAPAVTLVLDLDETLVHCSVDPVVECADLEFPVDFHGTTYQVHVRLRPHLFTFLEACRGHFEVVLFTASQKIYANELLNRIDPEGKYIQHRLFRESCLAVEGNFLKDLNVLGRDMSQTILVDNSPHAFGYQVDNGIPIESWFDDTSDKELLKLERFLRSCRNVPDVRPILRAKFACQQLVDDAPPFVYN